MFFVSVAFGKIIFMINKFHTTGLDVGFDFDVVFDGNQKINCIVGKNGIGKTQLLENMAKSLLYKSSIFIQSDGYEYGKKYIQNDIIKHLKKFELKLPLGVEINDIAVKNVIIQDWSWIDFQNIHSLGNDESFVCDKPIVFIGAKNRGFTKNINPDNIKILGNTQARFVESIDRTMKYINGEGLIQEEVANWIVSRSVINPSFVSANDNKTNEVVTILKMIEKLEPSLELVTKNDKGDVVLSVVYQDGKLLMSGVPIDGLSTGFVSIVKIFQEIIAGYGGWTNESDLSLVEGIVFIDEIEPHLHISWQVKIINILREFFPNTTFYITTHSPLVLSGLNSGEAYELYAEENIVKTKAIKNVDNYFLHDIINEYFGVDLNKSKLDKKPDASINSKIAKLIKTAKESNNL